MFKYVEPDRKRKDSLSSRVVKIYDKNWDAIRAFSCTFAFEKPKGRSGNNNTIRQKDCQQRLSVVSMDSIIVLLSSFFCCVQ